MPERVAEAQRLLRGISQLSMSDAFTAMRSPSDPGAVNQVRKVLRVLSGPAVSGALLWLGWFTNSSQHTLSGLCAGAGGAVLAQFTVIPLSRRRKRARAARRTQLTAFATDLRLLIALRERETARPSGLGRADEG